MTKAAARSRASPTPLLCGEEKDAREEAPNALLVDDDDDGRRILKLGAPAVAGGQGELRRCRENWLGFGRGERARL